MRRRITTILVADGDPKIRGASGRGPRFEGYGVWPAAGGHEAPRMARAMPLDLAVLDVTRVAEARGGRADEVGL